MLKEDVPDVPKLLKGTTVAAWAACMRFFLSKVSSVRDQATLVYAARLDENVGVQPHLINHGLIDQHVGIVWVKNFKGSLAVRGKLVPFVILQFVEIICHTNSFIHQCLASSYQEPHLDCVGEE